MRNYFRIVCLCAIVHFSLIGYSQTVYINEFVAVNNTGITDNDGDYSDWIELYNSTGSPISISGWTLSDDSLNLEKWSFPAITLKSKEYKVVFASGKDVVYNETELHTNFKLSGSGEYLCLSKKSGEKVNEFTPSFPPSTSDIAYVYIDGTWKFSTNPTPGKENVAEPGVTLPLPTISKSHGFYTTPISIEIAQGGDDGEIRYTTDCSEPTISSTLYTEKITIDKTTVIRAKSFTSDGSSSKSITQTYLFVDDIIHQSNTPSGYPSKWGEFVSGNGNATADYEMDPELSSNTAMAQRIKDALIALPVVSLVSDKNNFFSSDFDEETGGIYMYTGAPGDERGFGWERPASAEYFGFNEELSFQVNCGVKLHGGHSRRPEKSPKHGFRLMFKEEYGASKLEYKIFEDSPVDEFNGLVLSGRFCNSWIHRDENQRKIAQYGRDKWSKDTQADMGHLSAHSKYVHLYLNGMYWGMYNLGERINDDFGESYMGGNPEDYDVIKDYAEVSEGSGVAWDHLISQINKGVSNDADYYKIQGKNTDGTTNPSIESYVDVESLIDYMLINFFGANTDWDHHNWVSVRNRVNPGKGFKFFAWDQEHVLKELNTNGLSENNDKCPSNVFTGLKRNATFKREFADRVTMHLTSNGLLTPNKNIERWMRGSTIIEKSIDAESARWGDYRRDVDQSGTAYLYNKEDHWIPQREYLTNSYFPQRTDVFLNQLKSAGLYPNVAAPYYLVNGQTDYTQTIEPGTEIEIKKSSGTVYYTLDGSDPVSWSGSTGVPADYAITYSDKLKLQHSVIINARTFYNNQWSAMRSETFSIPSDFFDIRITEIHYNPLAGNFDGDDYEFIELKNIGDATLNLNGLQFTSGINYTFTNEQVLQPGKFVVLASDEKRFYDRYNLVASGEYKGNLDNGGELIILQNNNDFIQQINYDDNDGWPVYADGFGVSIVPTNINPDSNQNSPKDWRSSYFEGGSPFKDDTTITSIEEQFQNVLSHQTKCFPNPFTTSTIIEYILDESSSVDFIVYNLSGEMVYHIEQYNQAKGTNQIVWNGTNTFGNAVQSGFYIAKLYNRENQHVFQSIKIIKN